MRHEHTKLSVCEEDRKQMLLAVFDAVSHDLKTPLVSIIGSLEIIEQMEKNLSPEDMVVLVHTALTEAHKLNDLISDMLIKVQPK